MPRAREYVTKHRTRVTVPEQGPGSSAAGRGNPASEGPVCTAATPGQFVRGKPAFEAGGANLVRSPAPDAANARSAPGCASP